MKRVSSRKRPASRRSPARPPVAPPADAPVNALIVYSTVSAARAALAQLSRSLHQRRPLARLQPMLWRIDQLARRCWREMALRDAQRAAMLVFAVEEFPAGNVPVLERWVKLLLQRQAGTRLTLLVMIRDAESWTLTLEVAASSPRRPRARTLNRAQATQAASSAPLRPLGPAIP